MNLQVNTISAYDNVQLSLNKYQIQGSYKGNCLFAGLAIYQGLKEDLLLCSNRTLWTEKTMNITENQQSVVSSTSQIMLVLYSVRYFTMSKAFFKITTTKCTGILINPCDYKAYCSLWAGINMLSCDTYLESLSSNQFIIKKEEIGGVVSMNLHLENVTLEHSTVSCVHIYLSSQVIARLKNVYENDFKYNRYAADCFVNIHIKSDTMISDSVLTSKYQGSIRKAETLEISGHGNVITRNFFMEEHQFVRLDVEQCRYRVRVAYTEASVNLESMSERSTGRIMTCTLKVKGGSSSIMILRFVMLKSQNYLVQGESPSLFSWTSCKKESTKYQIFKSYNDLITSLSIIYGQILNIEQRIGNSRLDTTVTIEIRSQFCVFSCGFMQFSNRRYCGVLNKNDPFDSEGLSSKLYSSKYAGNTFIRDLYWKQILKLSHFYDTKVLARVLLPGIYKQVIIRISHTPTISLPSNPFSYLDVTWTDTNILEKVDISLQLNKKKYQIFTQPSDSNKMYTWMEAEDKCVKHGAHLPSFSSQSDVQDLVDIILRAVWTGPIRMIVIGLKVSNYNCISDMVFLFI